MDFNMIMQLHLWQGFSDQVTRSAKRDQCLRKHKFVFERMEVPQKEKGFRPIARTVALLSQDLTQPFLLCHFWFMSWFTRASNVSEDKFKCYLCKEW